MSERVDGRLVTPGGIIDHGRLEIADGRIATLSERSSGGGPWIVPGFVDIHCHGGGGFTFTTGDPAQAAAAAAFHLAHGTTAVMASLVSSPYELMREATAAFVPLVRDDVLAGIHYEGPYLAASRCGAQNPAFLRPPAVDDLAALLDLGQGTVRMVTLAPELPGGLDAVRLLVDRGVTAAVGHTDATYEQTLAAVAAGARLATHLFNGMPPPHHRRPGPVFALLGAPQVYCELIPDGVHLHDGVLSFAAAAAGPDRIALVTDAIAAAGMPDGAYELGGRGVSVRGGVARLAGDGGPIAGSTLTMDVALRRMVGLGVPIVDACRMAATIPARAIGLGSEIGALAAGLRADLAVLDDDLRVVRVMRAGEWVE